MGWSVSDVSRGGRAPRSNGRGSKTGLDLEKLTDFANSDFWSTFVFSRQTPASTEIFITTATTSSTTARALRYVLTQRFRSRRALRPPRRTRHFVRLFRSPPVSFVVTAHHSRVRRRCAFSKRPHDLATTAKTMALAHASLVGFSARKCHVTRNAYKRNSHGPLRAVQKSNRDQRVGEGVDGDVTNATSGSNNAVSRAESLSSSSTKKNTSPSLADYDEATYGKHESLTIHSDAFVPKTERAINKAIVESAVAVIDSLYEGRDFQRFYALETVARVPYFSFLSVLHLYETLGFWRRADYLKVHFAQTMNEFHHLLIMEAMGGDKRWADRFFAQHMAVGYYWMTCVIYLFSPRMAYNLSEQVESHAYHTYDEFLNANESTLKATPPPPVAVKYYTEGDLFLFDEFQTGDLHKPSGNCAPRRRPVIDSLFDVFQNVRDDEAEHMKTMQFCQLPGTILRAPSGASVDGDACFVGLETETAAAEKSYDENSDVRTCEGLVDCVIKSMDE